MSAKEVLHRTTLQLLTRFAHKARCRRVGSQRTADRVWRELEPRLVPLDAKDLYDAWIHYRDVHTQYVTSLDETYARVRASIMQQAAA